MLGFWLALFIIIDDLLKKLKARKIIIIVALALSLIYFGTLTIKRNVIWRDPITFYEYNLKFTPNSFIQRNNLGMAYSDAGRNAEAIYQYKTAISIKDIYPQIHFNLGNALVATGKEAEAETEYYKSINISPGFSLAYSRLVMLAIKDKDESKISAVLDKIKENFPESYYLNTAFEIYYYQGNYQEARTIGQEIMAKYPEDEKVGLMLLQINLNNLQ
jgi:tetratricopeptide (TPR) repeat protein